MSSAKRIMIIDDDENIRTLLTDLLESNGFEVELAEDGLEGMEKLKSQSVDLILIDIRLPYVSGIGLVRIAKQHQPGTPIICMTGYGSSPESIAEEECVGAVLSKPFKTQELMDAIDRLLK
ncbi:response regulator [Desulfonatronovibrio hydrogenovorans]|uniref:response regulator n=1 Tax=Desulfonatronovibrio hydrogenovorans TaxID=53245 RepID=UPI00055474D8|nr:response regulator [Desulfonatronovibrio hydrogenovorans]